MANKVQLKKSSVAARVPLTTDVDYGELALNYADGKLYYKKSDGTTIDHFPSVAYVPLLSGSYANPSWITSIDASKLTGTIDNARLNGSTYTINITGNAGSASAVAWSAITSKPTTLSGYGITDAYSSSNPAGYITSAGNAATASSAVGLVFNDGPRDLTNRLPNWNTRSVYFDFVGAGTGNGTGNYAGVMTFAPWTGTTASTGDASYQLAFANNSGVNAAGQPKLSIRNGIDSTWNPWYVLLHSGNYTSYAQSTLVSGTNIKTVNGTSLLGSGDLTVSASTATYAANSSKLYSTDSTYAYGSSNPYYGYLTYISANNRWRFQVSPATPAAVEVAYADSAGTADQIDSWPFRNTGNNSGVNADTIESNGITYYTSGVTNFSGNSTDGALYSQAYNSNWQHQIAGDYRSGQIALRGKNNGTWQAWRTVLDSSNYNSYSPTLTGGNASGTWNINVTGNSNYASSSGSSGSSNAVNSTGYGNGNFTWRQESGSFAGYNGWASYLISNHGAGASYYNQTIIMPFWSAPQYSRLEGGTFRGPYTFLTTENYGGIAYPRANRANGNFYIDDNYGNGIVGVYSSYRYQGVFAMGDSYKLPADGTTVGNLYGMAWSHPNAGGTAGNLSSHGLLLLQNGGFMCALSTDIRASGNVTAYSDERLKTNWRDMPEDFVARLASVKVGIYDRTDGDKITQVGVSAQSFQQLLPEAISTSKDEMNTLSVNYGGAALASAVELAKDNVELRARIELLEILISKLIGE